MKLEYFDDAFDGEGLILLYSGTAEEVRRLRATVQTLRVADASVALHDLDFIEAIDDCEVTASCVATGVGVRTLTSPRTLVWSLSPSDWERVGDLLEPFCHGLPAVAGARFQYLHERGGTEVIYSTERGW